MKIDFIFPPIPYKYAQTPYPSLGIGYLSSAIEENCEFETEINLLDGQILDNSRFWKRVRNLDTDVALLSATMRQMRGAYRAAEIVKSENEESLVVVGGAGPSAVRSVEPKFLNGTDIDIACLGEAENLLPRLLANYKAEQSLRDLPGLLMSSNGNTVSTPESSKKPDLDLISWPNREIFDMEAYFSRWRETADMTSTHIIGSRGCPFNCIFCDRTVTGEKPRSREPKDIVNEMLFLEDRYNPDDIFCYDDLFTLKKDFVLEISERLRGEGFQSAWSAQGRVDCVDEDMLKAMKEAGCEEIMFGVESGSNRLLDFLNKGFRRGQVIEAFDLCHKVGLKPGAYFIVGIPGETKSDIIETASLVKRIEPWLINFSYLTPFPNTELYDLTKGLIGTWDFEKWDDFGETVYTCDFDINPHKSEEMIRDAYLEKIEAGTKYCDYQFSDREDINLDN